MSINSSEMGYSTDFASVFKDNGCYAQGCRVHINEDQLNK